MELEAEFGRGLHRCLQPVCNCTRGGPTPRAGWEKCKDEFKMGRDAAGVETWQPASAGS